mmetsp:Transcript_1523/g.3131  ORF Transcript_1523/g.3131 Transcript_1523/m.3131 type:complete len:207 (+) Transcript_1523:751-1371(+)
MHEHLTNPVAAVDHHQIRDGGAVRGHHLVLPRGPDDGDPHTGQTAKDTLACDAVARGAGPPQQKAGYQIHSIQTVLLAPSHLRSRNWQRKEIPKNGHLWEDGGQQAAPEWLCANHSVGPEQDIQTLHSPTQSRRALRQTCVPGLYAPDSLSEFLQAFRSTREQITPVGPAHPPDVRCGPNGFQCVPKGEIDFSKQGGVVGNDSDSS